MLSLLNLLFIGSLSTPPAFASDSGVFAANAAAAHPIHSEIDAANCSDVFEHRLGTKIQRIWSSASQTCMVSVSPYGVQDDMAYRDHLFTSNGLFLVFNSFGPQEKLENTGAREFYFFPRGQKTISFQWKDDTQELIVNHITGDQYVFDARKARLRSVSRAQINVADEVLPTNKGGIEFQKFQGLYLDLGWAVGGSPSAKKNNSSTFKDSAGTECKIKNALLFKYLAGGDTVFRYEDDATLARYVRNRCPQLKFVF